MAKKYIPSGYQIININVEDKTSGTAFEPVTDDEKLLEELLLSDVKKPILLKLVTVVYGEFVGFPLRCGGQLYFISDGVKETIYASGDGTLTWEETEE